LCEHIFSLTFADVHTHELELEVATAHHAEGADGGSAVDEGEHEGVACFVCVCVCMCFGEDVCVCDFFLWLGIVLGGVCVCVCVYVCMYVCMYVNKPTHNRHGSCNHNLLRHHISLPGRGSQDHHRAGLMDNSLAHFCGVSHTTGSIGSGHSPTSSADCLRQGGGGGRGVGVDFGGGTGEVGSEGGGEGRGDGFLWVGGWVGGWVEWVG
jgi:hypothetical protein